MKNNKKAQVTILIIIAIIVIAATLLFFVFREDASQQDELILPEAQKVHSFVMECIENVGAEAIYSVGAGGGYYFIPKLSTDEGIPYYYYESKNKMPSKEKIAEQISQYINADLFFCTEGFVDFTDYEIDQEEIKTTTIINNEEVVIDVNYPIKITKGNSTTLIEDFNNIKVPIRLGVVYDSASEIISQQTSDGICLSCASDEATENDLYIDIFDYDDSTVIFTITDENSKINNQTFIFVFASQY